MAELVPPTVAPLDVADDDPRVGHLLGRGLAEGDAARVVIVGFPTDEGVRRNGGRPGAAAGPAAIRRALHRMTPDAHDPGRFAALLEATRDLGDLVSTGDLEADQEALAGVVAGALFEGAFPVVLGGGHETAYGHFLGHVLAGRQVEILNFDAHPDVRPTRDGKGHSGSPFRQALDHPSRACVRYRVAGIQPQSASRAHLDLVTARGGTWMVADELNGRSSIPAIFDAIRAPALVTFDLDAVDGAFAPGVSAPAAGGLDPDRWLRAAYLAGRTVAVASADVVELCPPHDADGRTARLAALTVWHLLRGLAARER